MANTEDNNKSTLNKPIGLSIDGVELYSPSVLNETIYFGELAEVNILNGGTDYDLINTSDILIEDVVGAGTSAKIYGNLKGKLKDVLVLSPGIGYNEKPKLSLVGGNQKGSVRLESNLVKKNITAYFTPNDVSIASTTITFLTEHNFENGEEVIYFPNNYPNVVGLVTNSSYYVGVVGLNTISLYRTDNDALNKVNFIGDLAPAVGVSSGIQYFRTLNIKNVIDKVYIEDYNSELYEKTVSIPSRRYPNSENINGINIDLDYIYAKNHNLKEKDLIVYKSTGTSIVGLGTTSQYYVTVIDEDTFKLSNAGYTDIPDDTNYLNKVYVSLNSVGVGTHTFKYPPIKILISTVGSSNSLKPPTLKPVVLGSYESIFIENYGVGYGISDVKGVQIHPEISLKNEKDLYNNFSSNAVFKPVIIDNKIVDVQILNTGNNYSNDIDIIVEGEGKYAKLYPIVENKKITKVVVLDQGVGYNKNTTLIYAKKRGKDAKFLANVKKWTVNQYFKNERLNDFIIPSPNVKNSLQYINFFPSNKLRNDIYDVGENTSPIVGWAYDGNPIYGPYIKNGVNTSTVRSSYRLNPLNNTLRNNRKRPPFPSGYFIQDYEYLEDKSTLDENNGMFIINDEFPNGTYAYFMTLDALNNPEYPYVIGTEFKNDPNPLNYDSGYNQNINLSDKEAVKNTGPLYLLSNNSNYNSINSIDETYKQDVIVSNTLNSNVESLEVVEPGTDYKVNDRFIFSTDDEQNIDLNSKVTEIKGKDVASINVGVTTYSNVIFKNGNNKIIGISSTYNLINHNDFIYIKTSNNSSLLGDQKVNVLQKKVKLLSNLPSSGIVTYITVDDVTGFDVDDYIKIDNEIASILEVIPEQSKFYIYRRENIGVHTSIASSVTLLPSKFEFDVKNITETLTISNKKYFNPRYSVGLGTTGSYINNVEIGESYLVNTQSIYIPDHNYRTNQKIVYNKNSNFDGLLVSNTPTSSTYRLQDNQELYAVKLGRDILGISTVASSTTCLTFRENQYNSNEIHSFEYKGRTINGNVEHTNVNIITNTNHQLSDGDSIKLKAPIDTWEYYVLKFDLNGSYNIDVVDSDEFKFNIKKPSFIKYAVDNNIPVKPLSASNISYLTNSLTAGGGISDIKIIYSSLFYKELPAIKETITENGKNAIIIPFSSKIGKIDTVQRIKDGFDYPTDYTLQPRLGTNQICVIRNNKKIKRVNVLSRGVNYNTPPTLKVIGRDDILLRTALKNYSVDRVVVEKTPNNLEEPLPIIPINNSNGVDILNIYKVSSTINRIELDTTNFPLMYNDYGDPTIKYPFKVGDLIFIENCKIKETTINYKNYNSSDNDYSYFEVVGINTNLGRVDYKINNETYGTYTIDSGYGTVVNKNDIAIFEMELESCDYINGETVKTLDENGNIKFTGQVLDNNGWNREKSELKITKALGKLEINDVLYGEQSLINSKVIYLNSFNIKAKLGVSRDKINYKDNITDLNSDLKKIQDSNYYQDFSYSIKGHTQYEDWKEPVKSIIHPSGFKEFSDLQIVSKPKNRLKLNSTNSTLNFNVNIEKESYIHTKNNFTVVNEGSPVRNPTQRIYFGSGSNLWPVAVKGDSLVNGLELIPYYLNKTNTVTNLKLASEFDGSYDSYSLGERVFTFNSNQREYLGVSTVGLIVGDKIGYSTYHEFPNDTKIISIGINSVRTLHPHRLYSGSTTQNLEVRRNLNQNKISGITSFRILSENNSPVLAISTNTSGVLIGAPNCISIPNSFENGQIIKYENIGGTKIGIQTTSLVTGGVSTDKLPSTLYVTKISNTRFKVSGLSTSSPLILTSTGSGIHKFSFSSPNSNVLLTIDNIIQAPIYKTSIKLDLSSDVGISSTVLFVSSGINSITPSNVLKIEDEYLRIKTIGINEENSIEVERAFLGSDIKDHSGIQTAYVYNGNYSIKEDIIYFTSPPFGPSGLPGIEISSKFNGRLFNRTSSPTRPNDKNVIFDDISDQFVGVSSFKLKQEGETIVGVYTNTNSESGGDLNNNPIILINNVPQVPNYSFDILNSSSNEINFIDESPKIGKILTFSANKGFGYQPLVAAGATVSVSAAGTISNVYLNGRGSGYRTPPNIELITETGYGASITAVVGASGSVTSLIITNPGVGYTSDNTPEVKIDEPIPYYELSLNYDSLNGIGTEAKVSIVVDDDSSISKIEITNSGFNYKVGEVLNVVGLVTDSGVGNNFEELKITVTETYSDSFSGMYLGQFVQFEDISSQFDSIRTDFDLITTVEGERRKVVFKNKNVNIKIENNLLVYINDILQVPNESYIYLNGLLSFKEPPKEESTCMILFYQGSIYDVDLIVPPETIKIGDTLRIEDSELTLTDYEQDDRVVKRIVSTNELDTFPYSGAGRNGLTVKPISWTKQKNDRVINGALITKSRRNNSSKIYPSAKLIWNFNKEDNKVYVDNAYPLFIELDNSIGQILEDQRKVNIIDSSSFNLADIQVNVSSSSTISSINIISGGFGYDNSPNISISSPNIADPFYNWSYSSGVNTSFAFNSLVQGDIIISVGSSSLVAISTDFKNWSFDNLNSENYINLNDVGVSTQNSYVAVGSSGSILIKNNKNSSWVRCGIKSEVYAGPFFQDLIDSTYDGEFNGVVYNEIHNRWVSIGNSGKICYANGPTPTEFIESVSQSYSYKGIDYNSNTMVAVGIGGISISDNGATWINAVSSGNYYSVIWDGDKFIATSDNSIRTASSNGRIWGALTNITPSVTFKKILKIKENYIGISTVGELYSSINLINWVKQDIESNESLNNVKEVNDVLKTYVTLVGTSGTIFYSVPNLHRAVLEAIVTNGEITDINVLDEGYGYSSSNSPGVIIDSPKNRIEELSSIKAIGDFGRIVGIKTSNSGIGTNSPRIGFELLSEYSESGYDSLNTFGITYSGLSVGDYFIIKNSNVGTLAGYALTGITTYLGGMSNYPASKIGTAKTFLDGVYRVDFVENNNVPQGIVTVTCHVVPVNGGISINTSGVTTNYYGNYSWSKIFDFQNRDQNEAFDFTVNADNGLVGLSSSPNLNRIPALLF
jgi:hypothetical protein